MFLESEPKPGDPLHTMATDEPFYVSGYAWPAQSMRSESNLAREYSRITQWCKENDAVLTEEIHDEGTPAPNVGTRFAGALTRLAHGKLNGVVIAVAAGPVVCVDRNENNFAAAMSTLSQHRSIALAIEDTWERAARNAGHKREAAAERADSAIEQVVAMDDDLPMDLFADAEPPKYQAAPSDQPPKWLIVLFFVALGSLLALLFGR